MQRLDAYCVECKAAGVNSVEAEAIAGETGDTDISYSF
jgi:hypothetical protein